MAGGGVDWFGHDGPRRPTEVIVVAVGFLVSALSSLYGVLGMAGNTASREMLFCFRVPPVWKLVYGIVITGACVYCGNGLLKMRKLAWKVSVALLGLGIVSLPLTLASLKNLPGMEQIPEGQRMWTMIIAGISAVGSGLICVVLLVLLFRSRRAFEDFPSETTEEPDEPHAGTPGIRDR